MIEFEFLHDMSLTGSGDRPWQTGWSGIFVRNRSNLILNVSLVMVMVTVRVMQTQQCIYVLASIVVVSIVLDSTVVDSTVLASTNAEILGYIVRDLIPTLLYRPSLIWDLIIAIAKPKKVVTFFYPFFFTLLVVAIS